MTTPPTSLSGSGLQAVAIDVETTGLDPGKDKIIEIGLAFVQGGQVSHVWESMVNPGQAIRSEAAAVHGITDDMVAGCRSIEDLSDAILSLTADIPILLAHGASFETRFLAAAGLSEIVSRGTLVDTLTLSRRRWPKQGNSLGIVATRLGIESPIVHRAGADAATCARVWLAIKGLDGQRVAPIDDRALERLRAKAGV